jgi:hypothetical protein
MTRCPRWRVSIRKKESTTSVLTGQPYVDAKGAEDRHQPDGRADRVITGLVRCQSQ